MNTYPNKRRVPKRGCGGKHNVTHDWDSLGVTSDVNSTACEVLRCRHCKKSVGVEITWLED